MQIVLNRKPIGNDIIIIKCIIYIGNHYLVLTFYKGILFKSITELEIVLRYPPMKINNKP